MINYNLYKALDKTVIEFPNRMFISFYEKEYTDNEQ